MVLAITLIVMLPLYQLIIKRILYNTKPIKLLSITERACNWIAHKLSKIPHDKKNIEDSSAT